MRRALAMYPPTFDFLLQAYEPVKAGQARLVDIIVGFIDPNAPDVIAQPQNPTKMEVVEAAEKADERRGDRRGGRRRARKPSTPARIRKRPRAASPPSRKLHAQVLGAHRQARRARTRRRCKPRKKLSDEFMELKLSPRMFDALILQPAHARRRSAPAREGDHDHRACAMPACRARTSSPRSRKNETNPRWLAKHVKGGKKYSAPLAKFKDEIERRQKKLEPLEVSLPPHDQRHQGSQPRGLDRRGQGAPREEGDGRGQPAPGDLDREEVHQPRPAVPGPDPGRQHRPHEGGGQVRIPPRLQVLAPTRPGGSARPSRARSPTRRAPSASRCT